MIYFIQRMKQEASYMKTFAAPDGTTVNFSNQRILVYGFSSDEISKIKDNIHLNDFELYTANSIEDGVLSFK